MLTKEYEELTPVQRVEFIGKLCHAAMSSTSCFRDAKELIEKGERIGVFDGVKILPQNGEEKTDNEHY